MQSRRAILALDLLVLVSLAAGLPGLLGCASARPHPTDRLESLNRPVFDANQAIDEDAFAPVAHAWIKVVPGPVRDSISNAYWNLTFPDRFVSSLGEGALRKAGAEVARFLINSTMGIAGFLDPATVAGIPKYDEDVGKMLAKWGVPPGPYIVIPILGSSTPRDLAGGVVDLLLNPLTWTGFPGMGAGVIFAINGRAQEDQEIETAKRAALDYYVFVRDAYFERRTGEVRTDYVTRDLGEDTSDPYQVEGSAPTALGPR
jgi:phospholipid-binding lipoprotein MlaA